MRPHQAGSFRRNYLFKFMFRSTELILPSKTLIADYKNKVLKKTKVSIVPNIIDPIGSIKLAYSKANSYNSKTMGHKITNVLYFAHLIESKGYKRALDIAKSVVSRNTNYHFFFVGEMGSNSDKKYFEHFVFENKLQDYIQYYGSGVEEKDKYQIFLNCDLLILPSYSESYPLTILEALSFGIPVVASNTGAISEIIGRYSGFVVSNDLNDTEYVCVFSDYILNITKKWTADSAIASINRYYNLCDKDRFYKSLSLVFGKE